MALLHVEPPGVPPFQRSIQRYSDVLARHSILELQIYTVDLLETTAALVLQLEQVSKEVEVWKNPQIRFIEVDKDRDVQDGVWVEIAQTNHPELQQIPQERMRHWEGLNEGRPPSGGDAVKKNARLHQSIELRLPRARWHPLFVTPGFGTHLLWVHSSPLRRHLLDPDWGWRQKRVWLRIWKCED